MLKQKKRENASLGSEIEGVFYLHRMTVRSLEIYATKELWYTQIGDRVRSRAMHIIISMQFRAIQSLY